MNKLIDRTDSKITAVINRREAEAMSRAAGTLDFYLAHYPEVYVVICNSCNTKLALEYKDPSSPNVKSCFSRHLIELSPRYRSTRWRTDDVMGYECACGNDNRWAYVEWEVLQHGGDHVHPHEYQAVKDHIATSGYSPEVKLKGADMIIENKFTIRRLNRA